MMNKFILLFLVFGLFGLLGLLGLPAALAQEKAANPATPAVKDAPVTIHSVPIQSTPATDGKLMFRSYCASCHGQDAKGEGPAAAALKTPPPDLTRLTARNKGTFPSLHVANVIEGDQNTPAAHGSKDMPVWGGLFRSIGNRSSAESQLRVHNLVDYLKTLQVK